jgi:virulence-associated protein VagC
MMQYAEDKLRELESQRNLLSNEFDKLTVIGQDKDRIIESKQKEIDKFVQDNKKVSELGYNCL